jgi:predicted amidophosphoribosyltransferase
VNRIFERKYRLHFQGLRISQEGNQHQKKKERKRRALLHAAFLFGLHFNPEDGGDKSHRNVG